MLLISHSTIYKYYYKFINKEISQIEGACWTGIIASYIALCIKLRMYSDYIKYIQHLIDPCTCTFDLFNY